MVDTRGEPVIMDFGLARRTRKGDARLTQQGEIMGTPAYMAPEQISGDVESMGPATDIYSLGVILYELLAGRLPFTGDIMAMLAHVLMDEPAPPSEFRSDLDPEMEEICLKAMAKKVPERHASMAELAAELADYLRGTMTSPRQSGSQPAASGSRAKDDPQGIPKSNRSGVRPVLKVDTEPTAPLPPKSKPPYRDGKKTASKPQPRKRKRTRGALVSGWVWLAGGAGAVLLVLLLWLILRPSRFGTIKIDLANLDGLVEITIDDQAGFHAGEDIRLKTGSHQIHITAADCESLHQEFTVQPGHNDDLRLGLVRKPPALPPVKLGTITIDVGAAAGKVNVFVDDQPRDSGKALQLEAATHQLLVKGPSYVEVRRSFTVKPGPNEDLRVSVRHEPSYFAGRKSHVSISLAELRAAAQQDPDDARLLARLGECYYHGWGGTMDYVEAKKWFEKAAELEDPRGLAGLGWILLDGNNTPLAPEEAVKQLRLAAKKEDAFGLQGLARAYALGRGISRDQAQADLLYRRAMAAYRKEAEQGDTQAMGQIGQLFEGGLGTTRDYKEAMSWFQKATEAGNYLFADNIGWTYCYGRGVARDYGESRRWFSMGSEKGTLFGIYAMGWLYQNGWGVNQDLKEAASRYTRAAEGGYPTAMYQLGWCYQSGTGVAQDYKEAMSWYRKAADAGYSGGMEALGWLNLNGLGVNRDYPEARNWYSKAATLGHAVAMHQLGWLYHNGWGVPQDYKEAMSWYRKAVDAGNTDWAPYHLGCLYRDGSEAIPRNAAEAASWFRRAAVREFADAQCNLGWAYERGEGAAKNYDQARNWYQKAATAGNSYGMNGLGRLYQNGWGVKQDAKQAMSWYRLAADKGLALAQYNLACLYESGPEKRDDKEAVQWFRKAADQGHADACFKLGQHYLSGRGVGSNKKEALRWYAAAAAKGHQEAHNALLKMRAVFAGFQKREGYGPAERPYP